MEWVELVTARVVTEGGHEGFGYTYTIGRGGGAVKALLDQEMVPLVIGEDALAVERIWEKLWWGIHWVGRGGIAQLAISAVDIALWDLKARAMGVPLAVALGGCQEEVPAYHTDCGWLNHTVEELERETAQAVEQGFRAVKIKVGRPELEEDVARLRAVRRVVGDGTTILVDANHRFTVAEAIRRGKRFEELGIAWFEEPIRADNVSGHAELRQAISIPIATGESLYTRFDFKNYIQQGAVDIVQADVGRVGGFTEWKRIADMALAWDLPVAPHYLMELHIHAAAAVPNGMYVEYIPTLNSVLAEPLQVKDGKVRVPQRPGHGILFDMDRLQRYAV